MPNPGLFPTPPVPTPTPGVPSVPTPLAPGGMTPATMTAAPPPETTPPTQGTSPFQKLATQIGVGMEARYGGKGDLDFDQWLDATGQAMLWLEGSSGIKEGLRDQYYIYRGGEAPAEGGAGAGSIFSPQEERLLTDLQNAVEVGQLSEEQAWKQLENYWSEENLRSRRSEEAGRRGETLLAGAFPGKTFPGTGPGGIGAKLAEKWGGPNLMPALKGIPMGQAQGIFGQAQQGMGLPSQLPSIQPPQPQMMNWQGLGQALPSFGGGGRNKYIDALLQQGNQAGPAL